MRLVLKWDVPVDDRFHPIGAGPVLHTACQYGIAQVVQVWTEETSRTPELRGAVVIGTGQELVEGTHHVGSVLASGGRLVWHVYVSDKVSGNRAES